VQERWQVVDGGVVRHRQAETDRERGQLRHEATLLTLARHPGVVEIVATDDNGDQLATRAAATTTLDGSWPPRPQGVDRADVRLPGSPAWLAALAAASQTVADLHALGLVHDDLTPRVIWVDDRGQVIFDGSAHAGLAGQQLEGRPRLRPSVDVEALARAAWSGDDPERGRPSRRGGPGPGLAAVLEAGRSGTWPPARRLAQALEAEAARPEGNGRRRRASRSAPTRRVMGLPRTAAPARTAPRRESTPPPGTTPAARTSLVGDPTTTDADPFARLRPPDLVPTRRRPPVLAAVTAVIGAVALAWGVLALVGHGSRPDLRPIVHPTARPVTAPQVVVDGTTYRIGRPGDEVQVGRWSCGPARAVVLRPSTGQVFAFSGWARAGDDLVAQPVGRVAAGSRLVTTHAGAGCDQLGARGPDGTTTRLDPEVTR
jgi:hypothetical protein